MSAGGVWEEYHERRELEQADEIRSEALDRAADELARLGAAVYAEARELVDVDGYDLGPALARVGWARRGLSFELVTRAYVLGATAPGAPAAWCPGPHVGRVRPDRYGPWQ